MSAKTKLLRKLSIAGINGVRGGFKDIKEKIRVATIIGLANGYKEKVSETMGVSYAFNGEFRAINRDGEACMAPVCYLPDPAQGLLREALDDENRIGAVQFAFDFFAVPDDTAIKGYVFECVPKIEPKVSDGLKQLADSVGVATPALEGPKAESESDKPAPVKGRGK